MKDYNEMAKSVFEKRDEYLIIQKRKKAMFYKAVIPVCSLMFVSLVSLLVWQIKLPELPHKQPEPDASVTEHTKPDDTSKGVVNSAGVEVIGTQCSSVQVQQSLGYSEPVTEALRKPTQNVQQGTEDNPVMPQGQGGKPAKPQASEPATEQIIPQPNTGGIAYPNSPETNGKPSDPLAPPTGGDSSDVTDCPTNSPEVPNTPGIPSLPEDPTFGADCTLGESEYPEPTTCCATVLPTEPTPTVPETTVPAPTGPLEITVADKTYVAQVGDKVTYTLELEAEEQFENIQLRLLFDKENLNAVLPKDSDGETIYKEVVPNIAAPYVGVFDGKVNMNAANSSQYTKFDFREKKVLLTMDFMVTKSGKTEITRQMQELNISSETVKGGWIDGVYHNEYTIYRNYFQGGVAQITEGIGFEEYLTVTPAAEILPDDTKKPEEETSDFVYPEENTDGDLLIRCNDRVYSADVGQRITYVVELEAAERFENFFVHLQYDGEMLDILPPEYLSEDDIAPEEVTLPNTPGVVVNYYYKKQDHVVASGSWLGKYNFKTRKIFLTLDFVVKSEGEVDMDFWVELMCIDTYRAYFDRGEAVISEGIEFYEYVIVN